MSAEQPTPGRIKHAAVYVSCEAHSVRKPREMASQHPLLSVDINSHRCCQEALEGVRRQATPGNVTQPHLVGISKALSSASATRSPNNEI